MESERDDGWDRRALQPRRERLRGPASPGTMLLPALATRLDAACRRRSDVRGWKGPLRQRPQSCGTAVLEGHDELDNVPVLQPERIPEVVLRNHLEHVRVMRADRHDHRTVHMAGGREEALRAAERAAPGLESRDLNPGRLLEDLELRKVRTVNLQVQRALVWLEPELLAELVPVPFLAHVERAFADAARDGARDRQGLFRLEAPLIVRVFLAQHVRAARREPDPLPPGRQVAGD